MLPLRTPIDLNFFYVEYFLHGYRPLSARRTRS